MNSPKLMKTGMLPARLEIRFFHRHAKSLALGSALFLLVLTLAGSNQAQQRMSKRYPAAKNVRIQLKNIFGTITVESWNRDEIKLTAELESPKATLAPRQGNNELIVDVIGDNRGKGDIGDINFRLMVPVNSSVDLETKRGNITVTNIRGELVSAHVSSEGDITLTGIGAMQVFAQNTIGDVFFDGEFISGGTYRFQSGKGNINIRIPANSAFNLEANALNRKIALNQFWNKDIRSMGDGRKYVGDVVDGRSKVVVTNFQGSITFIRR